jgi:hypothetical protein
VSTATLNHPAGVEARLEEIDRRLAILQNELEDAALDWFRKKRDRDRAEADAYVAASGGHSERRQAGIQAGAEIGADEEGAWEGKRHVLKTLETRSVIGTALLKSQGRFGA